jgi:hypothetical protein
VSLVIQSFELFCSSWYVLDLWYNTKSKLLASAVTLSTDGPFLVRHPALVISWRCFHLDYLSNETQRIPSLVEKCLHHPVWKSLTGTKRPEAVKQEPIDSTVGQSTIQKLSRILNDNHHPNLLDLKRSPDPHKHHIRTEQFGLPRLFHPKFVWRLTVEPLSHLR